MNRGSPDIFEAVKCGDVDATNTLVADSPEVVKEFGEDGVTPLHLACQFGHLNVAKILLHHGANPAAKTVEEGHTPLAFAVICGHAHIFHYLVTQCDAKDIPDNTGSCALHHAAMFNRFEIIFLVMSLNYSSINITDSAGHTPLMWAVHEDNPVAVEYLLHCGADVNCTDESGWTALHWACSKNFDGIAEKLLIYASDVNMKDLDGLTPIDLARENKSATFIGYLELCASDTQLALKGRYESYKYHLFFFPFILMLYYAIICSYTPLLYTLVVVPLITLLPYWLWRYVIAKRWPSLGSTRNPFLFAFTWWGTCFTAFTWIFHMANVIDASWNWLNPIFFAYGIVHTVLYHYLFFADPGRLSKNAATSEDILGSITSERDAEYCFTCMIKKPLGSKHCKSSGDCIYKFDHYCPWIANPVGGGNHRVFIVTVFWIIVGHILFMFMCLKYFWIELKVAEIGRGNWAVLEMFVDAYAKNSIVLFLLFFHFGMFWVHMKLLTGQLIGILRNLTVNEQLNYERYFKRRPHDSGSAFKNCREFWWPSIDWKKAF